MSDETPELLRPLVGDRYDYVQGMLLSKGLKHNFGANYQEQLHVPLEFLKAYFDQRTQAHIIEKLRNPPQLYDTLFELNWMKSLADKFPIFYEPKLKNRGTADFGTYVPSVGPIYFECKNPERFRTEAFSKFTNQNKLLAKQLEGTGIVEAACENGSRVELAPKKKLSDGDLDKFRSTALREGSVAFKRVLWTPIPDLEVHFVSRAKGYVTSVGAPAMQVKVRDKPVSISLENADIVFHPWPNLHKAMDRTTSNLLAEARRQLIMPKRGIGVICLNIPPSASLAAKLQTLLVNPDYEKILAVIVQGTAYYRSDRKHLVKLVTEARASTTRLRFQMLRLANWVCFERH